jgi:hypothetical protein
MNVGGSVLVLAHHRLVELSGELLGLRELGDEAVAGRG